MMRCYVTKWFFGAKKRVAQMHQKASGGKKKKWDWENREWENERETETGTGTFPMEFNSIKWLHWSRLALDMLVNTNIFYLIIKLQGCFKSLLLYILFTLGSLHEWNPFKHLYLTHIPHIFTSFVLFFFALICFVTVRKITCNLVQRAEAGGWLWMKCDPELFWLASK